MSRSRENGEGSIYRVAGGFRAYVWVETADGRRRRKYVRGRTRKECHERWLKLHQAAGRGPVASRVPTMEQFLNTWLEDVVEPRLAHKTVQAYTGSVRRYIVPYLGNKRLHQLTVTDVHRWLRKLADACQCCAQGKDASRPPASRRCCAVGKCCGDRLAEWSVHQAFRTLRTALSYALKEQLVTRNVATLVSVSTPHPERPRVWTAEQARTFLASARRDSDPLEAAFALMLYLGLRRGEVLGISWEDVDLERGSVRLQFQLQRQDGELRLVPLKTRTSAAPLPLPPACVDALRRRKDRQQTDRGRAGKLWHDSGLVFTDALGQGLQPESFRRMYRARIDASGQPYITLHSQRRTCGTLLAEAGVHPRVAMEILRHAQIGITMELYTQVSAERKRQGVEALGDVLKGEEDA